MKVVWIILLFLLPPIAGNCYDFTKLDSIINSGIQNKFYPGAQVLIGTNEGAIYLKSYGYFTYDDGAKLVNDNSLFDLASVTKVIATTSAVMKLYDDSKIDLNELVSNYLPDFKGGGKEGVRVYNLLLHNSGFKDWMPFYTNCKDKNEFYKTIYNHNLVYKTGSKFLYSDLNFITLCAIVEKISGKSLDEFCKDNIFTPLQMTSTTFNPDISLKDNILPTEFDKNLRNRMIQGEVHDENAFIMGGVSGHAGLFSNAHDLYLFMRMMLLNGNFEDDRRMPPQKTTTELFKESTVKLFTTKVTIDNYKNSRAYGWDTKQPALGSYRAQCGELISDNCFGHTGFTGTSVWCDRERKLIIIFLTNRVNPTRENQGFKYIRPEVQNEAIRIISE